MEGRERTLESRRPACQTESAFEKLRRFAFEQMGANENRRDRRSEERDWLEMAKSKVDTPTPKCRAHYLTLLKQEIQDIKRKMEGEGGRL